MSIFYILAALLLLGILVTVHESGHFFAARLTGIPVKEFAIGFGPKILSWKSRKHETAFCLRLIPAGGYCMFYGEDDIDGREAAEDPRSFGKHAVWRRIVTVLMGPGMNLVLAFLVASALFAAVGLDTGGYYDYPTVEKIAPGSPAEKAGLLPGDVLLSIGGQDAQGVNAERTEIRAISLIKAYDPAQGGLPVTVRRGDREISVTLVPEYAESEGRYMIGAELGGLAYHPSYVPLPLHEAVPRAAEYCVEMGGRIIGALKDLLTTGAGIEESAGPVGIVHMIAEETKASGFIVYTELLVLISVNLGLFNLLPIPGLDGSRLVFLLVEGIRRKPVPRKLEAWVHTAGFVVLIALMLVITYRDILRIIQ